MHKTFLIASLLALTAASGAVAQSGNATARTDSTNAVTGGTAGSSQPNRAGATQTMIELPEACRAAVKAAGQGVMANQIPPGQSLANQPGQKPGAGNAGSVGGSDHHEMANFNETQRGLRDAMMQMQAAMTQGMMAKDPDTAWICAMIPHHQGAIAMAEAGLRGADNAESRKMAEDTIRMQREEIAKLTRWVETNAERDSGSGTVTGSTSQPSSGARGTGGQPATQR